MPLAHVFNMSLQEGIVPLEWKEVNIIPSGGSWGPGARNSVGPSAMGETKRLPAGALEAPWRQTHVGNNMKIG